MKTEKDILKEIDRLNTEDKEMLAFIKNNKNIDNARMLNITDGFEYNRARIFALEWVLNLKR